MESNWDRVTRWAGIGENESGPASAPGTDTETLEHPNPDVGSEQEPQTLNEPPVMELPSELDRTRAERDQLVDRLARLQAEFDNARKRDTRERADAREYTVGATVEPFLAVMDNFQLALQAQGSADQLRAGVGLILKQMDDALKSLQVVAVETVGTQFDPRLHEALGSVETAEHPDQQVIEEVRRGYKIREKLLRPALVRIASNTGQVEA